MFDYDHMAKKLYYQLWVPDYHYLNDIYGLRESVVRMLSRIAFHDLNSDSLREGLQANLKAWLIPLTSSSHLGHFGSAHIFRTF